MIDHGTHSEMLFDQNHHFSENELQGLGSVTGSRPNIGLEAVPWRKDSDSNRIGRGVPTGIGWLSPSRDPSHNSDNTKHFRGPTSDAWVQLQPRFLAFERSRTACERQFLLHTVPCPHSRTALILPHQAGALFRPRVDLLFVKLGVL